MASLIRSVLSVLSGQVGTRLIGVAFTPLLVRVLTQSQYGVYSTLMAGFAIVALASKVGLLDATRKTVAEYSEDAAVQSAVVTVSLFLSVGYFVVMGLLAAVALVTRVFPLENTLLVLLLTGSLFFSNVFEVVKSAYYGVRREQVTAAFEVAQRAVFATVGLGLAYVGFDLRGVFAGHLLSFAVVAVAGVAALATSFDLQLPSPARVRDIGCRLFRYGGTQVIGGLSALLLYKTDILLVRYFRGATATALYNSAIIPAEYVWFVPAVLQTVFLQRTATLWANDDVDAIDDQIETGLTYGILSLSLFGVGMFVLAGPFLRLYFGSDYATASLPLRVLIGGTIFFGLSRVLNPVLQATGWLRYTEGNTVLVLVVNVALNLLLIPRYGILGAAVATGLSYVLMSVGVGAIMWRSPFQLPDVRFFGKLLAVQAAFAVPFVAVASLFDLPDLLALTVLPVLGGVLFVAANVSAGIVSVAEVRSLYQRVGNG